MKMRSIGVAQQRRVGIVLSYISMGVSTIISLLYTPYMLRCLGQSEYGMYQLVGALANYLSLLSLGLSGSYIRFYNRYLEDEGEDGVAQLNGMYAFAFCIISCTAIVIGIFLTLNIEKFFHKSMTAYELKIGKIMMLLMTINAAITLSRTVFTAFITAKEKFIFQRSLTLACSILHSCFCMIVLYQGGKSVALVWIALISTILVLAAEIYYSVKQLDFRIRFRALKWEKFLPIFSFSAFVLLNDIINQVNWSVDKVILGAVSGTITVSVYGIASQLNTYFLSISTTIISVYAPKVYQIAVGSLSEEQKTEQFNELFFHVGRIQSWIVLLVTMGYISFGKQFIVLWAGKEYELSYYVGLWLMLPVALPLLQNTGIEIQRSLGKHRTRSIVYSFIAIVNILISIPLGRKYGAVGCAIGTAISLIIGNILFMNWYYYKYLNINIYSFWRRILTIVPALILPGIFGVAIKQSVKIDNYLSFALWIIIYTLVYCASLYLFALKKEEKKNIQIYFLKLFRRKGAKK